MRYIISDIHGCYNEYKALLEKIQFSEEDTLYVLGDAVDRGPEPIKVLQDMMSRQNVVYFLGNHDYLMWSVLRLLMKKQKEQLSPAELQICADWFADGGEITAEQFAKLAQVEQEAVLQYIQEAEVYDVIEEQEKRYILSHAGLNHFEPDKPLEEYELEDFIEGRMDYNKRYFKDENTFLVSGHTPTPFIHADFKPQVYCGNGHIEIDCGCTYGGKLVAFCVETEEFTYVDSGLR